MKGAVERNLGEGPSAALFDRIAEFAAYAFPKAHSVAYALIVYQTAYLKANYPREFFAAVLTIESSNHDKLSQYIGYCREREIAILPPDVNESERTFSVVGDAIRFGLSGIKNIGSGAIDSILAARDGGPFEDVFDFALQTKV